MMLLNGNCKPGVHPFHSEGTDKEELFQKNLKEQPMDWEWRDIQVSYTLNSQGYRCPEWSDCNWSDSVLIFGCSYVFGEGISDDHTVAFKLSKLLQTPVINLGACGSSPMFQWCNSIRVCENNINPKLVIYIWPGKTRSLEFISDVCVNHSGLWEFKGNIGYYWSKSIHHGSVVLDYFSKSVSSMWECPVLEYTIDQQNDGMTSLPVLDQARDLNNGISHPGRKSNTKWAEIIYNNISLRNI